MSMTAPPLLLKSSGTVTGTTAADGNPCSVEQLGARETGEHLSPFLPDCLGDTCRPRGITTKAQP
jgi:hypothetical protein